MGWQVVFLYVYSQYVSAGEIRQVLNPVLAARPWHAGGAAATRPPARPPRGHLGAHATCPPRTRGHNMGVTMAKRRYRYAAPAKPIPRTHRTQPWHAPQPQLVRGHKAPLLPTGKYAASLPGQPPPRVAVPASAKVRATTPWRASVHWAQQASAVRKVRVKPQPNQLTLEQVRARGKYGY